MSLFLNASLFLNTHTNRIDGKGRISFPAPFRTALAARNATGVVIFQSLTSPAIEGWPMERMQELSDSLDGLDVFSRDRSSLATTIFGSAQELQIDKEGRCSLPQSLCDYAGIAGEAAFLGQGQTFQIWEPATLARHTEAARADVREGGAGLQLLRKTPTHRNGGTA